ncbi:MAG: UvrB/UvrC motif-containing protein [Puniceicoccales bacterium]|nr:UvrB/UvrC motif-containing protein [Puniceicoccales bacterium]
MSKEIPCDSCGQPATVHLTKITDNKVTKVHFCEKCAAKNGVGMDALLPMAEALSAMAEPVSESDAEPPGKSVTCPRCGLTLGEFHKGHRLGCAACYSAFGQELGALLRKIQPGRAHCGKKPSGATLRIATHENLEDVRKNLRAAVEAERYEDAARLRDRIRQLEQELSLITGGEA